MADEFFTPQEPVQVVGFFTLELCKDASGNEFIRRANDGIDPYELMAHLESIRLDMLLQLNSDLAKRTQRTIITRTVVEKPAQ